MATLLLYFVGYLMTSYLRAECGEKRETHSLVVERSIIARNVGSYVHYVSDSDMGKN